MTVDKIADLFNECGAQVYRAIRKLIKQGMFDEYAIDKIIPVEGYQRIITPLLDFDTQLNTSFLIIRGKDIENMIASNRPYSQSVICIQPSVISLVLTCMPTSTFASNKNDKKDRYKWNRKINEYENKKIRNIGSLGTWIRLHGYEFCL